MNTMKKMNSRELLNQLEVDIRQLILKVKYYSKEDASLLLVQVSSDRWSVAQILEHLNSYGRYYLPHMAVAIHKAERSHWSATTDYNSGWLGDYFTRMMLPGKDGRVANRMKSPKNHQPPASLDAEDVLKVFLGQQYELLELLHRAKNINIGKARVPISISKWIKLKLGDTMRFFVAHEQRHFLQADNTLKVLGVTTDRYPVNHPVI
jgi:hypothetical protein